jgi:hypothetical protein
MEVTEPGITDSPGRNTDSESIVEVTYYPGGSTDSVSIIDEFAKRLLEYKFIDNGTWYHGLAWTEIVKARKVTEIALQLKKELNDFKRS